MSRRSAEEERPSRPRDGSRRTPLIVIGCSWGGLAALHVILERLPASLPAAVAIVQHRRSDADDSTLVSLLSNASPLPVYTIEDKDPILPGRVIIAPANYHLLVDEGGFALSTDAPVSFSRPSIDVLFESAARSFGPGVTGVVLTGANNDGAAGLAEIRRCGGHAIVQEPATAEQAAMPRAAIEIAGADEILPLKEIAAALVRRCAGARSEAGRQR